MAEPNIRIILYEIRVRIVRNVRNLYIFIAFRTFVFSFKIRTRISYTFRTFVFRTRISDNFVRISYSLYKITLRQPLLFGALYQALPPYKGNSSTSSSFSIASYKLLVLIDFKLNFHLSSIP